MIKWYKNEQKYRTDKRVAFQFNLNNDIKISKRDKLRLIQGLYFKKYQKVI